MKVKEILKLAAENLGRDDLAAEIGAAGGAVQGEAASLLRCYNLVENEIALDYFPLKYEEKALAEDGKVFYTALSYAPVNVHDVKDKDGKSLNFRLFPTCLSLSVPAEEVTVFYSYAPAAKSVDDDSSLGGSISARLISFGVAAEFCLSNSFFREAQTWEGRYRDALRAAGINRRKLAIGARRWI